MRSEAPSRMIPNDFPPREAVYRQTQRSLQAGVFEVMAYDLRAVPRLAQGLAQGWPPEPMAAVLDSRTLHSTPESGARVG